MQRLTEKRKAVKRKFCLNPFTPKSDFIDFTLSNARRFYSSNGDPLGVKGLMASVILLYIYYNIILIFIFIFFSLYFYI